jgi:hypothetical protein
VEVISLASQVAATERAIHPEAVALALFAGLAGVIALTVIRAAARPAADPRLGRVPGVARPRHDPRPAGWSVPGPDSGGNGGRAPRWRWVSPSRPPR